MHSIESYSRYLHQLVKEGKFGNVIINFAENSVNFTREEIATNPYLVGDMLKCYKEQGTPSTGLDFLKKYQVDVFRLKDVYAINQYGWLLHACLKNSESNSDGSEEVVNSSMDFLSKISFLEENNRLLINQLFGKIIGYEKKRKPIVVDNLLKLLKSINIKHEQVKSAIVSEPYVVGGIMDIFRKSGHVERAFGFLKFLNVGIDANTPEQILNSYGWCLYSRLKLEMNDNEEDDSDTPFDSLLMGVDENNASELPELHPTNETLNLISNCITLFSLDSTYSPFSRLFNLSLKSEKQKPNPNWAWMEEFLSSFKGKPLSNNCDTIQFMKAGKQKTVELASDFETWHSYYSLSLLKQKKFRECIENSKDALFNIEKFHYNNDLWFARKIALSNKGLGNIPQAIKEMEAIEKRKAEWFIQKELAELYFEISDLEKAKEFAIKGALNFGEKEKKDGLFFLLGQIFQKANDKVSAYKHFLLAQLIRSEQEWSVPNKLKLALEETFSEEVTFEKSAPLYKELLKGWKESVANDRSHPKKRNDVGKIIKVNSQKHIGMILGNNGDRYFFHFNDFKDPSHNIALNTLVEFKIKPPKGNREGMNWVAFDINPKK